METPTRSLSLKCCAWERRPSGRQDSQADAWRSKEAKKKEWYSRGYLPHRDKEGLYQMITYHLADSLPADVLQRMRQEIRSYPSEKQDIELRKKIEEWADAGHGSCVLRNSHIAAMVVENWKHYDGKRYDLLAYVVMPNHVHVLIFVYSGVSLAKIVQSWKGYAGKKIKEFLDEKAGNADRPVGRTAKQTLGVPRFNGDKIWHREYWDRFIRNEKHYTSAVEYILQNPVRANLVKNTEDWLWSFSNCLRAI